ncbi:MAG: hypothetical protein B6I32_08490 [Desulfobacterium sp. 4572_20]|nr:MAG: hypothetical protein B6I32_08490 [Desulfobacterium sp. 4572_20]RLB23041.1 MAG: hypothetical protein DRG73_05950 [Deltaproteobacteria bacterium]
MLLKCSIFKLLPQLIEKLPLEHAFRSLDREVQGQYFWVNPNFSKELVFELIRFLINAVI